MDLHSDLGKLTSKIEQLYSQIDQLTKKQAVILSSDITWLQNVTFSLYYCSKQYYMFCDPPFNIVYDLAPCEFGNHEGVQISIDHQIRFRFHTQDNLISFLKKTGAVIASHPCLSNFFDDDKIILFWIRHNLNMRNSGNWKKQL